MAVVVLVHGAWQSAATGDLVAPRLQTGGCDVHAPLLTGLGSAAGELTPGITLDTHIGDVVRLIERQDLADVTLVGHSYAGMIITGVAERARARLARLVYVDAFVPDDGQSALELLPPQIQTMFRDQANAEPDGFRLRAGERQLDLWGLEEGPAREFVRSRLCDFSINCFEQPVTLATSAAAKLDRTYIACVGDGYPAKVAFDPFAARA